MNPNHPDPQSQPSLHVGGDAERAAAKPAADAGAKLEASAKLKEAQSKLLEAEAKLVEPSPQPANRPMAISQQPAKDVPPRSESGTDARPPTARRSDAAGGASARTDPTTRDANDADAKRPGAVERLGSAAKTEAAEAKAHTPSKPVTEYLSENVAGMLCYLFGWVSGLVFLFVDRRPFVRFHAAQSVAVFATLNLLILALSGFFLGALVPALGGALYVVRHLLALVWLVAAVVLILKVAGGERFRVKIASEYGDRAARGAK